MRKLICILLLSAVVMVSHGQTKVQYGCMPAYPYPISYLQADGTNLTLTLKGDETVNWAITEDQFTLIKNLSSGSWEYATLDESGNLVSTNLTAHNPDSRTSNEITLCKQLTKGIKYSKNQIDKKRKDFPVQKFDINAPKTKATFNMLVILANFNNTTTTYTQTNFDNYMNLAGYNFQTATGSVKDYYLVSSYNAMTINATVLNWVTVGNTHDYYGPQNNWPVLARDAINAANAANPSLDFSQFDNDNDGYIDAVAVFHQGPGQEATSNTNDVWSHTGSVYNYNLVIDGVQAATYTMQPEKLSTSSSMITVGVMIHELGHNLGLPDLYDTDYSSSAIGEWDVMAGGSWLNSGKTPPAQNCWSKYQMGWLTPTVLTTAGTYTLNNTLTSTTVYRVNTATTNEYFLLENRQKTAGTWDYRLPGHGMLIYHIDGSYINSHWSANTVNDDETHQGVDIEEADGSLTTANNGDAGDPFPGTSSKTSFTDATNPNSKSWAGANTAKPITSITEASGVITFVFMGGSTILDAEFTANTQNIPAGGSINFTDLSGTPSGTTLTSWSWTFTGGTPATYTGQTPPAITYSASGSYPVSLTVTNSASATNTETKTNYINVAVAATSEWITQYNGFTTQYRGINCISIVDANTAWATVLNQNGYNVNEFTKTTNSGTTWTKGNITGVAVSNKVSNICAVSTTNAWIAMYDSLAGNQGGIFVTTNGGSTWTKQTTATYTGSAAFPNVVHFFDGNNGFCQGDPNGGYFEIYTTTNGGTNWTRVPQANIPAIISGEYGYTDLYDTYGNTIWFGTNKGRIFKSTDKGLTWTATQVTGFTDFTALSFNDASNGIAMYKTYSGTTLTGVYISKTTNGGSTWTAISTTSANMFVGDIDAIPGVAGKLVGVGLDPNGINQGSSYSTDHGASWINIDNGIQYICCKFLNDETGWAGGFNDIAGTNGAYKWHNLTTAAPVVISESNQSNIYPNPASDVVNIEFEGVQKKNIEIRVVNILGKEMLAEKFFSINSKYSYSLNCSEWPNGIYIAVITNGDQTYSQKFIVK